ncbi:MAG: decaprenyl-phosphate phosphoribosyltransferase [Candidatus Omnitrophica bacterium]|nr:decaprenyl-phosphate phosphoribosyltransferase [Candidatus Omnitrophota bacterium]
MNNIISIIRLMRVKQWIKNFFLLAPIIFSGRFTDRDFLLTAVSAFFAFCFISSGVYICNDLADIRRDAVHPKKCLRPLASGRVSIFTAVFLSGLFITGGMGLAYLVGIWFAFLAGLYLILHGLYNFIGKRIVLFDVVCIALGFCIRIWAGAVAVGVLPSVWLQLCVFLLALFLGFTKRRSEMVTLRERSGEHRSVLKHYSLYLLDQLIIISATLSIVFYGLYTISPEIVQRVRGYSMAYSLVFVVYGIFRYLYLIHVRKLGDDPGDVLVGDMPMLVVVTAWILYSGATLYFLHG